MITEASSPAEVDESDSSPAAADTEPKSDGDDESAVNRAKVVSTLEPASRWEVEIDPAEVHWKPVDKFSKGLPAVSVSLRSILVPATPSPLMAIRFSDGQADLWDLSTGESSGGCQLSKSNGPAALSPDGRWIAEIEKGYLNLYATSADKPHKIVQTAAPSYVHVAPLFARAGVVLVEDAAIRVYDPATGACKREFLTAEKTLQAVAISPGGRYLAFWGGQRIIQIIDLDRGRLAGTIRSLFDAYTQTELAFSPDGAQLAAYLSVGPENILLWDVATGDGLPSRKVVNSVGNRSLSWLGDSGGWLLGGELVVKPEKESTPIRLENVPVRIPVQADVCVTIRPSQDFKIHFVLTLEKLSSSADVQADPTAIKKLAAKDIPPWSVVPDPAPPLPPGTAAKPIALDCSWFDVEKVFFATAGKPRAFVAFNQSVSQESLMVVDLAAGERTGVWKPPIKSKIVAVSRDGRRAALLGKGKDALLHVVSIDDGQEIDSWQPREVEELRNAGPVTDVEFVDQDHLLLRYVNGTVNVRQVSGGKRLFQGKSEFSDSFAVSPGRRYLVVQQSRQLVFYDLHSGDAAGALSFEPSASMSAMMFHPDGTRLAAKFNAGPLGTHIVVWKVADGSYLGSSPLPDYREFLSWSGNYVVATENRSTLLIDAGQGMPWWNYEHPNGHTVRNAPDGRYWILQSSRHPSKAWLGAHDLPDPFVQEQTAGLNSPGPILKRDSRLGIRVSIDESIPPLPGRQLTKSATDGLKKVISDYGCEFVENSNLKLALSVTQRKTGESLPIRSSQSNSIDVIEVGVRVALIDEAKDQVLWHRQMRNIPTSLPPAGVRLDHLPDDLYALQYKSAALTASVLTIPENALPEHLQHGWGTSVLTTGGIENGRKHPPLNKSIRTLDEP